MTWRMAMGIRRVIATVRSFCMRWHWVPMARSGRCAQPFSMHVVKMVYVSAEASPWSRAVKADGRMRIHMRDSHFTCAAGLAALEFFVAGAVAFAVQSPTLGEL